MEEASTTNTETVQKKARRESRKPTQPSVVRQTDRGNGLYSSDHV